MSLSSRDPRYCGEIYCYGCETNDGGKKGRRRQSIGDETTSSLRVDEEDQRDDARTWRNEVSDSPGDGG